MGSLSRVLSDVGRDFAVTGSVGTREMKQLARAGSEMAIMLGGPLTAAVGLVALTFITTFGRARKEMEDTRKKAVSEIAALQDAGDLATIEARARALEIGKPSAGQSERVVGAFKGSLRDLRAELQTLEAQARTNPFFGLDPVATKRLRELRSEVPRVTAEIESLRQAALNIAEPSSTRGLQAIEVTADAASVSLERAARAAKELAEMNRAMALQSLEGLKPPTPTIDVMQGLADMVPIKLRVELDDRQVREQLARLGTTPELLQAADSAASSINAALTAGITEGLAGIFTGDLGESILSGLGSMIMRFGEVIITFSGFLETFKAALLTNPIFAGATGFLIGAAMIALGGALRGAVGGGGGRGGGFGGVPMGRQPITSAFTLGQPGTATSGMAGEASRLSPVQPIVNNFTVIGEHDPVAQRTIVNLVNNASLRGHRVKGTE